jgi:predicted DCC family thiol-disulfide oxidoreductase YuxK
MRIVFEHDKSETINFAPVQSVLGAALLMHYGLNPNDPASFIFLEDGPAKFSSSAVFALSGKLKGWPRLVQIFWIIPRPLTDLLYKIIARNRYKWFGKSEACLIPTPEMKSRLINFPLDLNQ